MGTEGLIKGESLRDMLGIGAEVSVTIEAEQDAFVVLIGAGLMRCALQAKRGHVRRFKSLDSAAQFLCRIGCRRATIELERWRPEQRTFSDTLRKS